MKLAKVGDKVKVKQPWGITSSLGYGSYLPVLEQGMKGRVSHTEGDTYTIQFSGETGTVTINQEVFRSCIEII